MAIPGEVNQNVGRAYQQVFIAALQASIPEFQNLFTVENEADKMSFEDRSGATFSFDFSGRYADPFRYCEVFGESKGYAQAGDLLAQFRLFLAKAYVTSTDNNRHRDDKFWFVTNVPFACSAGSGVRTVEFVRESLKDPHNQAVRAIVGKGRIDNDFVRRLVGNLGVFILTDSFLRSAELSYTVKRGDTLWSILGMLHGGRRPGSWQSMKQQISELNNLASPDQIRAGERLRLPWYGISSTFGSGLF